MRYQRLLDRCPHVSTETMSYEEWLEKRRGSIGGSDAGAIMGLSGYASPLTVYLYKKNLVPKTETSNAARRGSLLEPIIRGETAKDFPELEIEPVPCMFTHPDHPFMSANLDGVVYANTPTTIRGETITGLGGFEAKSAKTSYGWRDDEIPDPYYAQVQHYMAVLDLPWFLLSVYILESETIRHYVIPRNEEGITRLVAAEQDFWEQYVVKNVMPAAIGIDREEELITDLFAGGGSTVLLGTPEAALCGEYLELTKTLKALEARKQAVATDLKAAIIRQGGTGQEKKITAKAGGFALSWSRFDTQRVDTEALKKAGLFDRYAKHSESSRFGVTAQKTG